MTPTRLIALVVAWPLFQNNLDSTMLGTALPTMAQAMDVKVLHLNLAITCYLLGLSLCLPLSGWAADRWGARRVFLSAVALFSVSASLCGLAPNLEALVGLRLLQGVAGALMLPSARILLLRHVTQGDMVEAMIWFTVPPTVARLLGPLAGGALVTWGSWQGVFLVHLPIGLLGLLMLWRLLPRDDATAGDRAPAETAGFDGRGFLLLATSLTALTTVLEIGAKGLMPAWGAALLTVLGLALGYGYVRHALRAPHPLIDLRVLRHRTFRISTLGATGLRISLGAIPFLLPLLMQAGFGLSPLASGAITAASALGSLGSRGLLKRLLARVGFRTLVMAAVSASALCCAAYGQLSAEMPVAAIFALIFMGGVCNSIALVAFNSLAFSDVGREEASHATITSTMSQQLSIMFGVAAAAALLSLVSSWHADRHAELLASDFAWVFAVVALVVSTTVLAASRLRPEDGESMRPGRGQPVSK